ncbi:hypothetical protein PISMIDRAFT_682235 [Pisolithus microcarpus 441]|uniref:Uncharacterized protein n=1 Tax=Pisolithus microcarpus 441 TaxID=765257 RepID=A0A0C9Z2Z2_9AGAM|nr:hypothetical protein PISMIDRAFT_682235 [Pisolithus microcarpus 441]
MEFRSVLNWSTRGVQGTKQAATRVCDKEEKREKDQFQPISIQVKEKVRGTQGIVLC